MRVSDRLLAAITPGNALEGMVLLDVLRQLFANGIPVDCPQCGMVFRAHAVDHIYCSDACRKRASYERIKARRQFS